MMDFVEIYRGEEIWKFQGSYTVEYMGDEIAFNTVKAAKEFIDSTILPRVRKETGR